MLHRDTLTLLFPTELSGDHQADIELEGAALDVVQAQADQLLLEMFPGTAYELLEKWEKVYGVPAKVGDSLQQRRSRVLQKMRELGRLDIPYFIELAAGLGITIIVDELHPLMAGWGYAGDELGDDDSDWCWRVWITDHPGAYFRAGESTAGEYLSDSYTAILAEIFNNLKPADTFVEFIEV